MLHDTLTHAHAHVYTRLTSEYTVEIVISDSTSAGASEPVMAAGKSHQNAARSGARTARRRQQPPPPRPRRRAAPIARRRAGICDTQSTASSTIRQPTITSSRQAPCHKPQGASRPSLCLSPSLSLPLSVSLKPKALRGQRRATQRDNIKAAAHELLGMSKNARYATECARASVEMANPHPPTQLSTHTPTPTHIGTADSPSII